jgi:hypothetical protein
MKKCFDDIQFCDRRNVLELYTNGPITGQELYIFKLVRLLQKMIHTLSPLTENFTKLTSTIGSRRILLAAPARGQERILKSVTLTKNFATFRYWHKKSKNTAYLVETDQSKITGLMSKYDEKMPILDLNNILFFKKNSNCPLAENYDVMSLPYARSKSKVDASASMCPTLVMSCCVKGSFSSFIVDSKIARLNLKSFYKNLYKLDMFLLSGLFENFKLRPEDDYNLECQGPQNASKCLSLALNIKRAIALAQKHLKRYRDDWTQCYSSIEEIRNQLRCAACDPVNNKWINHENKTIVISRPLVSKIVKKCYNKDLFEIQILRGVYEAFLNYARQVIPTLNISSKIIWKIFTAKVEKCAKWTVYTQADQDTDFSKSPDCMTYSYGILEQALAKPSNVRFTHYRVDFFQNVIGALINRAASEQMATLIPDIVRPFSEIMQETEEIISGYRKMNKQTLKSNKEAAMKNSKKIILQQKRVLMSEEKKKKLDLNEQRMMEGKRVKVNLSAEPHWHFIVSQNKNDGIKLETYGDGGVRDLGISNFLDKGSSSMDFGAMLKNLATKSSKSDKKIKTTSAEKK